MLQSTDSKRNRSESNSVTLAERFSLQQFYRKVKPAMIQVVHGCHVGQLANVMHKLVIFNPQSAAIISTVHAEARLS